MRQQRHVEPQRYKDPPIADPVEQPEQIASDGSDQANEQCHVPGEPVARAGTEVIKKKRRQQNRHEERVREPAEETGDRHADVGARPRRPVKADQQSGLGHCQQRGEEQIDVAGLQVLATRPAPPNQDAERRRQQGRRARQPESAPAQPHEQRHGRADHGDHQLVRTRVPASAVEGKGQLGWPTTAVEYRRLRIARVEIGVVAGQAAAVEQGVSAEVAVVEVKRMPA